VDSVPLPGADFATFFFRSLSSSVLVFFSSGVVFGSFRFGDGDGFGVCLGVGLGVGRGVGFGVGFGVGVGVRVGVGVAVGVGVGEIEGEGISISLFALGMASGVGSSTLGSGVDSEVGSGVEAGGASAAGAAGPVPPSIQITLSVGRRGARLHQMSPSRIARWIKPTIVRLRQKRASRVIVQSVFLPASRYRLL
jgi:hypothetical protein